MSDPIDLDLVELRAKVRGWLVERDEDEVTVEPHGLESMWFRRDGYLVADLYLHRFADTLTAPRWTLARLLESPPEGWRVVPPADPDTAVHVLAWGDEEDAPRAAFGFVEGYGLLVSMNVRSAGRDLARLAARHKAAAELALILAEVEP